MTPERKRRVEKLRKKLVKIAGSENQLESLAPTVMASSVDGIEEGLESMSGTVEVSDTKSEKLLRKIRNGDFDDISDDESMQLEAIVERNGRPVSFIQNGTYQFQDPLWTDYNGGDIHQKLTAAIPSIGRVERFSPSGMSVDHVGTGFIVGERLMMTNRHVAEVFVTGAGSASLVYSSGGGFDFGREQGGDIRGTGATLRIKGVKMVHPYWDMALFELADLPAGVRPLQLSVLAPEELLGHRIATIGYPGRGKDPSPEAQELEQRFYEGIYGVKRIAPGEIDGRRSTLSFGHQVSAMLHDSSTLAGNSGSGIFAAASGHVIGLHFKGKTLDTNYSVPIHELARDRRVVDAGVNFAGSVAPGSDWEDYWKDGATESAKGTPRRAIIPGASFKKEATPTPVVPVGGKGTTGINIATGSGSGAVTSVTLTLPLTIAVSLGSAPASMSSVGVVETEGLEAIKDYSDREGYDQDFLGTGLRVPLPKVVRDADKVLRFGEDDETELKYHHYSVVMHEPRRQCIYSAVNIDGKLSKKTKRTGWLMDTRIPEEAQIMKECYGNPPKFSRGHMTRREDPAWGDKTLAAAGNADSMHVTNTVPQMQPFNAPIWLALEDYALQNAREDDMRITVFTGPVFRNDDPVYYGVKVPVTFWKVIAFIHDETGKLCATGYTMSQKAQLPQEGLEFVFGQHEQSQTSLKHIQDLTGLKFGAKLLAADAFESSDGGEESAGTTITLLSDPEQIRWV